MTTGERASRAATRSARVVLLDLLRLIATFQMVQGHTLDAVLAPEYRSGAVHGAWLALRGLTSVAFLFIAGLSFQLATLRDFERHREDRGAVARRFRRAGTLLLLGYALHFPVAALVESGAQSAAAPAAALVVDVLHCIGVSLAVLETLVLLLPSRRSVELACCALAVLVLAAAPALAQLQVQGPLSPLLHYVSARGGSLFPLLPWAAHVLLGVGLGGALLDARTPARRGLRLLAGAAALLVLAALLARTGAALAADHLGRLGWVLAFAALLSRLELGAAAWPAWTRRLAGETLFVYVFHVLLVYGHGLGLAAVVGERLAPLPAVLLAGAVLGLSAAGALVYRRTLPGLARSTATG